MLPIPDFCNFIATIYSPSTSDVMNQILNFDTCTTNQCFESIDDVVNTTHAQAADPSYCFVASMTAALLLLALLRPRAYVDAAKKTPSLTDDRDPPPPPGVA